MNTVDINFDEIQCSVGKVQRLSTPSYITCRTQCDATRWCWYWNGGNSAVKVWMLYEVQCCYVLEGIEFKTDSNHYEREVPLKGAATWQI